MPGEPLLQEVCCNMQKSMWRAVARALSTLVFTRAASEPLHAAPASPRHHLSAPDHYVHGNKDLPGEVRDEEGPGMQGFEAEGDGAVRN